MCRHTVAPHAEPRYFTFTDREAQSSSVMAMFKHPAPAMLCPEDYLQHCRRTVFHTAMNSRFFKLSRRPDPPFFAASVRRARVRHAQLAHVSCWHSRLPGPWSACMADLALLAVLQCRAGVLVPWPLFLTRRVAWHGWSSGTPLPPPYGSSAVPAA